ncbi:MAG TPA: GvpL/GvpF family gas vesicle protein [Chloroflexota bacterium]|nr:GvpL/GvpF family gas vesicle protein [Chloroflexota bacterium]
MAAGAATPVGRGSAGGHSGAPLGTTPVGLGRVTLVPLYVYCLLTAPDRPELADLAGIDANQPLTLRSVGSVVAVLSQVGADFEEDRLNDHVRDLEWLSPRAVRHHAVVDALYARASVVLPLAFATLFASPESLDAELLRDQQALLHRLEFLRGKEAWELKLRRDATAFEAALVAHSQTLRDVQEALQRQGGPGATFMLRKKLERLRAEEALALRRQVRVEVHAALSAACAQARVDSLDVAGVGESGELEMKSAYLVDHQRADGMKLAAQGQAAQYGQLGYSLELSGPWPAFSFAGALGGASV